AATSPASDAGSATARCRRPADVRPRATRPGHCVLSAHLRTPALAWVLLFVAPAMFATNILVARLAADWLPPLALTFWRWFFTALLACALAAGALRAAAPALKREWPGSLLLGAIRMTLCGAPAHRARQPPHS